ncbi:glycine cleavage system aminomethyltransferase GcvT [Candidatus Pelagibacter bacterium]|nr:glycine cleavage system aminomethyltransferase GcvT [Candidatus Pelagibacter bacterium]MDA8772770.1 glycine cleavage system aminomethyltransferase GcvT [Candidatus Pelagibacter bacterium]
MEVQKTALYNLHKSLGAKFVPFAGYEMPIQYKDGIVKEHISTRSYAGFFDVSHMGQFFLEGDDTLTEALEKIIPADLKSLKLNHSKYSFLLNSSGGIIDDLIITKTQEGFCIILNAACKENDVKEISKFLKKNHKHFINSDLSLIALQGPKAVEILEKLTPGVSNLKFMTGGNFKFDGSNLYITRSGYTGEDGFEVSIPNNKVEKLIKFLVENKVNPIGLGARDTLRLEAGLCLYGHDLNEKINPIEANLKWAIAKRRREEGGFNGWEKIKELIANGSNKKRVGILPEGRIIARENTKIFSDHGEEIGLITSGTFGPSVNASVAMGYINSEFSEIGTKIQLEVRGKKHGGKVSELPFFKKSYVK